MATPAFPVACIVLAAGAGRRYGMPKAAAALEPGGEIRFVDRVTMLARDAGAEPVLTVLAPGIDPPAIGRTIVGDPEGEPISSLRLGLAQLANTPSRGALVWPVDHPHVRLESVLAVLDAAQRGDAAIVIPTHEGRRGHPTWFGRDSWRDLMTVERDGARGVIHAWRGRVAEVEVSDAGITRNVNERPPGS